MEKKTHVFVLSPREHEIALLVAQGLTNKKISDVFGVSVYTVRNQVVSILRKLNATNRSKIAFIVGQQHVAPNPRNIR